MALESNAYCLFPIAFRVDSMTLVGGIVAFVILWWLVFFMVLPWGVTSQLEAKDVLPGSEPGAPVNPALGRKVLITTILAALLWGVFFLALESGWLGLERFDQS